MELKLWIKNASQVVQICTDKSLYKRGASMNNIATVTKESASNGVSILVDQAGKIYRICYDREAEELIDNENISCNKTIDAEGMSIIPGFVDAHTHPVWVGDRINEFSMKLSGASYMDIHAAGGGINYTVDRVREAHPDELYKAFSHYVTRMRNAGSTLIECKSGYGLDLETELKQLKVIERGQRELDLDLTSTYCGAHAIPRNTTAEEATTDIIERQLPTILQLREKGDLQVDQVDVFCEQGVFDVSQTKRIIEAASPLQANFHAEELNCLNSVEMGVEIGVAAMSHLECISDEGVRHLAQSDSVAVLLPTTAYTLRLEPPPARRMIDAGVVVALGTDFNPNAHCLNMALVMNLACVLFKMTPEEALVAATLNSAAALSRSHLHGSLEEGKLADMILINANRWDNIIYQMGDSHHLINHVIKNGKIIYSKQ